MSSKRQMTMAKMQREQAVREKRARKQEKKAARKLAAATPATPDAAVDGDETADVSETVSAEEPTAP